MLLTIYGSVGVKNTQDRIKLATYSSHVAHSVYVNFSARQPKQEAKDSSEDSSEYSEDSEPDKDETDRVQSSLRNKRSIQGSSGTYGGGKGPPSNAKLSSRPKWLPPGYKLGPLKGNPVYGYRMQLYCRTGYHLGIFPDKKVRGIGDNIHPYALIEFSSAYLGEVRIRGVEANLYLAMNKKGKLYGEVNGKDDATVFVEYVFGQYTLYLSRKWAHLGWYVGIKKSGKIKPGHQTRWGQKAIQFLPRRIRSA